jgi:hypothetical protein
MRVKWQFLWVKFAPVWVTLWLVSYLAPSWQMRAHDDGTLCLQSLKYSVVVKGCCSEMAEMAHADHASLLTAPVNCFDYCDPVSQSKKTPIHISLAAPAVIPAATVLRIPLRLEKQLPYVQGPQRLISSSRAPPIGRGPPFDASLSLV